MSVLLVIIYSKGSFARYIILENKLEDLLNDISLSKPFDIAFGFMHGYAQSYFSLIAGQYLGNTLQNDELVEVDWLRGQNSLWIEIC